MWESVCFSHLCQHHVFKLYSLPIWWAKRMIFFFLNKQSNRVTLLLRTPQWLCVVSVWNLASPSRPTEPCVIWPTSRSPASSLTSTTAHLLLLGSLNTPSSSPAQGLCTSRSCHLEHPGLNPSGLSLIVTSSERAPWPPLKVDILIITHAFLHTIYHNQKLLVCLLFFPTIFYFLILFIILGCIGSSLLPAGFL